MTLDVKFEIKYSDIFSLLVDALEGGSNYWYMIQKNIKPENFDNTPDDKQFIQSYPLNKGGALMIDDSAEGKGTGELKKPVKLDLECIKKGLQIMAVDYPRHFADFIREDYDATTADVFLQCCVLGKIIYG